MAMNASTLSSAIATRLKNLWRNDPPASSQNDKDYFLDNFAAVIAEEVISHIQSNARCNGADSNGDSHNNVGIL